MGIWIWRQTQNKYWRVETDASNGTIKVTDENGGIISEHTGLSRETVELMEENFFNVVAVGQEGTIVEKTTTDVVEEDFNPMYA